MAALDYAMIASYTAGATVALFVAGHQLMAGGFQLTRRALRHVPRAHSRISRVVHIMDEDPAPMVMMLTFGALLIFGPFLLSIMPPDLLDEYTDHVAEWFLWTCAAPLFVALVVGLGWGIADGLYWPQPSRPARRTTTARSRGAAKRKSAAARRDSTPS